MMGKVNRRRTTRWSVLRMVGPLGASDIDVRTTAGHLARPSLRSLPDRRLHTRIFGVVGVTDQVGNG
ncbi:hypothetical protein I546_2518 [Mycobacterium kansasii 732]|nr:hypothetical protein I546_2518 [Mycobacterium kansasii 732]